jgi:putative flavoprotein involved in K+ transport
VLSLGDERLEAATVAIATGSYQSLRLPPIAAGLPGDLLQLHAGAYRSPKALPEGAVLVVGSAQSGCQIAEELYLAGRRVYLSVGRAGRVPRRYRGRDTFWWLEKAGFFDRPVASLPSPRARFAGNPHLSGRDGGRTLNLHRFARDGVTLVGHLAGVEGDVIRLAPDLHENLANADQFAADAKARIDAAVVASGLDAPLTDEDREPEPRDGFETPQHDTLDLRAAGIATVIWATGFGYDFGWIKLPILDEMGYPVTRQGVTAVPGLYVVGLHWLHTYKSGLLAGVGEDIAHVAAAIATAVNGG